MRTHQTVKQRHLDELDAFAELHGGQVEAVRRLIQWKVRHGDAGAIDMLGRENLPTIMLSLQYPVCFPWLKSSARVIER
jgi:hypothetical protein